ncbi:MAG: hypothetical protein ACP5H2_06595 [Solirubrobacteraceae bacterium]
MIKLRTLLAGATSLGLVAGSAGVAVAAGNGYGGGSNGHGTPAGFTAVKSVSTVNGKRGGSASAPGIKFKVPAGSSAGKLQVVVYKGRNSTAKKDAAKSLKRKKVLSSFGVGLFQGPTRISSRKLITATYSLKSLKKGDVLAVYRSKTRKFTDVKGTFAKGRVVFKLKAGESVAIFS